MAGKIIILIFFIVSINTYGQNKIHITSGPQNNLNVQISVEILREAYASIGYELEMEYTSYLKSLSMASTGKSDGELFRGIIISEQYKDLVMINEPLFSIDTVAFYKDKNINISGWEDLRPYKITYERGIKTTEQATASMNAIASDNLYDAFHLMDHDRVSAVVTGKFNGQYYLKDSEFNKNILISKPLISSKVYHYLNVKNSWMVPKLESALKKMNKEEIIKRVIEQ